MKIAGILSIATILGSMATYASDELRNDGTLEEIQALVDSGAIEINEERGTLEVTKSLADILKDNGDVAIGPDKDGGGICGGGGKGD